jgi:hypothetical protein
LARLSDRALATLEDEEALAVTRRLHDLVALLGSILDAPFAQPHSWTEQLVRRNAVRGELPANRVVCPSCDGELTRRVRGVPMPCERCMNDKGRPLGWIYVDLMVDEPYRRRLGSLETGLVVQVKTVHCDAGCDRGVIRGGPWRGENDRCLRCGGSGRLELTIEQWRSTRTFEADLGTSSGNGAGPILDSMESRQRSGSYDELAAALVQLHEAWPALYRLVIDRYVLGQSLGSARLDRLAEEGGLAYLEARMPEEIRVPGSVRKRRREEAAA